MMITDKGIKEAIAYAVEVTLDCEFDEATFVNDITDLETLINLIKTMQMFDPDKAMIYMENAIKAVATLNTNKP